MVICMALDSNQPIAGSGPQIRNKFIEHLIALGLDRSFARLKPKLLGIRITETDSGFACGILNLKLIGKKPPPGEAFRDSWIVEKSA